MKFLLLFVLLTQCREMWQEMQTKQLLHNTNFDIAKNEIEYWQSTMYSATNKTYKNNIFCACSRQFVKMLKYSDAFFDSFEAHKKSIPDFQDEYCSSVECSSESRVLAFKCPDPLGVFSYAYQSIIQPIEELNEHKKITLEIVATPQHATELQFFEQLNSVKFSINFYLFPFINYTKMEKHGNSYKFIYDFNVSHLIPESYDELPNNSTNENREVSSGAELANFIQYKQYQPQINVFRIYYIETRGAYCGNSQNLPTVLISHISLHTNITKDVKIEPWVFAISTLGLASCLCAGCIFGFKILFKSKKDEEELSSYRTIA